MKIQSLTAWVDTGKQSKDVSDETFDLIRQIPGYRDNDVDHHGRLFVEIRASSEAELHLILQSLGTLLEPPQGNLNL